MKFLLIPLDYHRHSEDPLLFTDMVNGFAKQGEAKIFTTIDNAIEFKPDVIFYQGSLPRGGCEVLKEKTGAIFTMWTGDTHYMPVDSLMLMRDIVDIYFVPHYGTILERYKNILGKPCYFIYEPLHEWKLRKPKQMDSGYTCFVGNAYDSLPGGEERIELIELLSGRTHFEVRGAGTGSNQIPVNDVPDFYNNAYITICENNYHDIEGYFTPRNLLAMGAGSCAVMKVFPGIENHFRDMVDCIYYRHKYELLQIIEFLRSNPDMRNTIAENGYKKAQDFTYSSFAEFFAEIIKVNFNNRLIKSEK